VQEFVRQALPQAEKVAARLNVPVDAVLGQWGLETGWGKSVIPGTNNLGNIKDFSNKGPKAKDNMTGSVDSYRAYANTDGFADDFANLLTNKRYAGVAGTKDAVSYFDALKRGGYAEDPNYVTSGSRAADMAARARLAQGTQGSGEPKIGAFTAPAKPENTNTTALTLNPGNGVARRSNEPVEIPQNMPWSKPVTAVQAKPGALPKGGGERALVTYVGDGDGATLRRGNGETLQCRIDTIDAPEVARPNYGKQGQPFGEEAKRTLAEMIENKEVTVKVTKAIQNKDGSTRFGCQIEIEGKRVDQEMLRRGAAWLYRRYANDPALVAAENEAKAGKIGLWADPNPENPETFRRRQERASQTR
jgi:endonuclease YncB( thermonuclease family)